MVDKVESRETTGRYGVRSVHRVVDDAERSPTEAHRVGSRDEFIGGPVLGTARMQRWPLWDERPVGTCPHLAG